MKDDIELLHQQLRFAERKLERQRKIVKDLRRVGVDAQPEEDMLLLLLQSVQRHRRRVEELNAKPPITETERTNAQASKRLVRATLFLTRFNGGYRARLVMKPAGREKQHVQVRDVSSPSEAVFFGRCGARLEGIDRLVLVNRTGMKISGWPDDVNEGVASDISPLS